MYCLYDEVSPSEIIINSICKNSSLRNKLFCDVRLYNHKDISKEILSGIVVINKKDNTIIIRPDKFNLEIINQSNTIEYYKCILYGFKNYTHPSNLIDDDISVVLNKCKIDANFEIYMYSDETYVNLELIPFMSDNEKMMTFLVSKEGL